MSDQFILGGQTELRTLMQERGQQTSIAVQAHNTKLQREIRAAAEHILRDRSRLDPRWRDPLSPAPERRAAVVAALTAAITEARRGEAAPATAVLAQVPATDESTLLKLYDNTVGWSTIQTYFDLPDTTEIKFVGEKVQIFTAGQPPVTIPNPLTPAETEQRARILAQDANQPVNALEPQRSLALGYGTRVTMVLHPRALKPFLTFRRGRTEPWKLDDLIPRGTLNSEMARLLRFLLRARLSMITVGATGSGKTALLETLLNELNGHIITIEDGAQEITLQTDKLWTPQVVDIVGNQHALNEALLGVLRQTPDVVAVGECRGSEAGAILSLATSDHQMLFTIHAEDARGALRRFASRATMRGADYEGRFEDALLDTVHSLSVIIVQQYWGQIGRRIITEIALAAGVERDNISSLQPMVIPLAQARVEAQTGTITWDVYAQPNAQEAQLEFNNGQSLPQSIEQKIQTGIYRAWSTGHTGQTSYTRVDKAIERATSALAAERIDQALAEVRMAWKIRADEERLLPLIRRILERDPQLAQSFQQQATQQHATMQQLIKSCNWIALEQLYRACAADPVQMAFTPPDGWQRIRDLFTTGQEQWQQFDRLLERLDLRIESGAARETLDELDTIASTYLDALRQQQRLEARVQLLSALQRSGQVDADIVASAQTQLHVWHNQQS